MENKNLIITLLTAIISCVAFSCKDTGTGPNQKPFKDPREMTWTADTLKSSGDASQLLPVSMVAFAPNDVWLACWSDVAKKVMWHYDGLSWKESDIEGQSGPIGLDALAGNSSNDLWAGGFYDIINSKIALSHFNGSTWTRVDLKMPGEILDMCTDPSGNIWACGRNGVVLKYSQGKWTADTAKILNYNLSDYFLKGIKYFKGKIYLLASIGGTRYAYLAGDIKNWILADTMRLNSPSSNIKWGNMGLYKSSDEQLYAYGLRGIWSMTNSGWEKIFDFDGEIYGMYGASKKYLLGVSDYRAVCFFDGSNWNSIGNLFNVSDPTFEFKNVWTDGYAIFLVGFGTINGIDKTIIWHGK